ncbi:OmpA family protein, partial [bacterium]|nr:OmpA family protein [bacterium]
PGAAQNAVPGLDDGDLDAIRGTEDLKPLTEEEWRKMIVVGDARVEPISFRRGSSELDQQGQRDLDGLVTRLHSWRSNYITVVGHARADGDPEANLALAQARADTAKDYLTAHGISQNRVRAVGVKPSGNQGSAQTVSFALMQQPY